MPYLKPSLPLKLANPTHRAPTAASALLRIFSPKAPKPLPPQQSPPPPQQSPTPQEEFGLYRILSAVDRTDGGVKNAINEYIKEGKTVRKLELEKCMKELSRFKRYHHAFEIGEWILSRKLSFKNRDHANYLVAIAKVKGIAAAENYFNALPPSGRGVCTYGALLGCYCIEKMADKALDLFNKMVEENMINSPWPFNHLINMYIQIGQPDKAVQLGEELKKGNIQPNTYTYNSLISAYSLLDDFKGMERVLTEMKSKKRKLCNWTTYSYLADIYIRAKDHEKAKLALIDLEKEMGVHQRDAYHYLISLYTRMSDAENVRRVWKSLKLAKPVTSNTSYLIMLRSLDNLDDMEGMKECFVEWELGQGMEGYDLRLANTVIRAYLKRDMLEEAESVLKSMPDKSEGPFFYAWESFMLFYLERHNLRKAMEFMETAVSQAGGQDWKPRLEVTDGFLKYFEKESDVSGAEEFYELMKRIKCIDSYLYESLLRTYVGAGMKLGDARGRIERDEVEVSSELEDLIASISL